MRPEDLSFSTGGKPDGGIALDLKVEAVERIGAETFVYGHHTDAGEILVRVPGRSAPPIGEAITAVASRAKLHVFTRRRPPADRSVGQLGSPRSANFRPSRAENADFLQRFQKLLESRFRLPI